MSKGKEKKKILIVDDEMTLCELMYDALTRKNYSAQIARSAEDAICVMKTNEF